MAFHNGIVINLGGHKCNFVEISHAVQKSANTERHLDVAPQPVWAQDVQGEGESEEIIVRSNQQ